MKIFKNTIFYALIKCWKEIAISDKALIIIISILLVQCVYNLFTPEPVSSNEITICVIVRTTVASIFGYFLSENFLNHNRSQQKNSKTEITVTSDDNININDYLKTSNNNNFIDSFGKLIGKKTMEVKELLDKEIKEVNSNEYSDIKISLYTKITKFVKLEITSGEDKIVVKSNDKGYSFEIVDSEDNNTYNGTIKINNNSDSTTYNVNVKDSNNLEIKINNTINKTTKIEKKDVSNSILLEDITEKEYEDIINKISNNKAFNKIYEDISNSNIEIGDIA